MTLHPISEILAGVPWTELSNERVQQLSPLEAGQRANTLYAGITRANIPAPTQTGVNLAHSDAAANVHAVLASLRARANAAPTPPEPPAVVEVTEPPRPQPRGSRKGRS